MSRRFSIPGVPNIPFRIIGPKKVSPPPIPLTGPNGEPLEPVKPAPAPKPKPNPKK